MLYDFQDISIVFDCLDTYSANWFTNEADELLYDILHTCLPSGVAHWSFLCDKNGTTIDHGCHDYRINPKQALLSGPLSVTKIDRGNHDYCIFHRARN